MRIVFENLHENLFLLRSVEAIASGRKPWPAKHQNILHYYLTVNEKIYIYINEKGSWFANGKFHFLNKEWMRILECYVICKINKISWRRVVILKAKDIRKDDILITYLYSLIDNSNHDLDKIQCYKVLDMNHFYARIPQFKFLPLFDCLVSESDIFLQSKLLNNSPYFTECLYDTVVVPYTFRKCFVKRTPFNERKNKAVATGTCTVLRGTRYKDLRRIYHVNSLHPMRMDIYCHKDKWNKYIDCRISLWPNDELEENDLFEKKNILKIVKKIKNKYTLRYLGQKKYYSFNMTDLYNEYKMAIIGEEVVGSPAVGFVEAMACGCAFIGIENGTYEKYGMKAGIHYIGYNGTNEDMLRKISYYQNHERELETLAKCGYIFAINHFNGKTVAKNYFEKICGLAGKRMSFEN